MIDLLSKKVASGDLYLNLAVRHLQNHEWGLARRALEEAMAKGRMSEPNRARILQNEIHQRMFGN